MRVTVLGSGSAIPDGQRMQAGYLVETGGYAILLDCGSGILHRVAATDVGIDGLDAVLLSHHHLDHVSDLIALLTARWLVGADPLPVVGPPGTEALLQAGIEWYPDLEAITLDAAVWSGSPERMGPFTIRSTETVHSTTCFGYRLEADGAVVTYSGDTEACEAVISLAENSDVLIHDCSFPDGMEIANHTTPAELAAVLEGSTIDTVLLTHLYPMTAGIEPEMRETVAAGFDGTVEVAEDGMMIDLCGSP